MLSLSSSPSRLRKEERSSCDKMENAVFRDNYDKCHESLLRYFLLVLFCQATLGKVKICKLGGRLCSLRANMKYIGTLKLRAPLSKLYVKQLEGRAPECLCIGDSPWPRVGVAILTEACPKRIIVGLWID